MRVLAFATLLLAVPAIAVVQASDADLVLRDVRVVDGTGAPPRARLSIRIVRGRIVAMGPGVETRGARVLTLPGTTVVPGLIDAHVHLAGMGPLRPGGDAAAAAHDLDGAHLRGYL